MNKERRKAINKIKTKLMAIKDELEVLKNEEDDFLDNFPANLNHSGNYEQCQLAVDSLDLAVDTFDDIKTALETATDKHS